MLLELLDPSLVKFQFQMSTISRGFVAAEVLHEIPGPIQLDARAGRGPEGGRARGRRRPGVQVAVGKGSIDWKKTFQAARTGGVTSYYVEQSMPLTRESVAFLKALTV